MQTRSRCQGIQFTPVLVFACENEQMFLFVFTMFILVLFSVTSDQSHAGDEVQTDSTTPNTPSEQGKKGKDEDRCE